jgi:hypothetical protein
MKIKKSIPCNLSLGAALMVAWLMTGSAVRAQQITGLAGSPNATVTLKGKQLPPPPMPFGGVIKESASSTPWWPPRASCRPKAPPTSSSS